MDLSLEFSVSQVKGTQDTLKAVTRNGVTASSHNFQSKGHMCTKWHTLLPCEMDLKKIYPTHSLLLLLLLSHFSRVWLCDTPETAAHQAPPSLGFSRQEHWSGLPFPPPIHESEKWQWSRSVVFDSSRPHGQQPTRLLRSWDFPGKSTGVGCRCLLRYYTFIYS